MARRDDERLPFVVGSGWGLGCTYVCIKAPKPPRSVALGMGLRPTSVSKCALKPLGQKKRRKGVMSLFARMAPREMSATGASCEYEALLLPHRRHVESGERSRAHTPRTCNSNLRDSCGTGSNARRSHRGTRIAQFRSLCAPPNDNPRRFSSFSLLSDLVLLAAERLTRFLATPNLVEVSSRLVEVSSWLLGGAPEILVPEKLPYATTSLSLRH